MPEYLAPGVYVEEIDTGSKPIEGVSTSTAGMVGVTERGPANVPILITSFGEFSRWFGGYLNRLDFDEHRYLPHAVEGFFTNGGKRVFITRVLDLTLATRATAFLFDRGVEPGANTVLLRPAGEGTGTAANPPLVLVLPDNQLSQNDWIRIGDGSEAEYHQVTGNPVPDTVAVIVSLPLLRAHVDPAAPIIVGQFTPAPAVESFQLLAPAPATRIQRGEQTIDLSGTQADLDALIAAAAPRLLVISETGKPNISEHRLALEFTRSSPTTARVRLDGPLLLSYANNAAVDHVAIPAAPSHSANLDASARAGDGLLFVDNRGTDFDTRTDLVIVNQADNEEVRRLGELRRVSVTTPLTEEYPANTLVEAVRLEDDNHLSMNAAAAGLTVITVSDVVELSVGQSLVLGSGAAQETSVIQSIAIATRVVTLRTALAFPKPASAPVIPLRALGRAASAGATSLTLNNRRGLTMGDVIRIGPPPNEEYVTITRLPAPAASGPNPGVVLFEPSLTRNFPQSGTPVVRQNPPTTENVQPSVLLLNAERDADTVLVSDGGGGGGGYPAGSFLRLTTPSNEVFYHRVSAISPAALGPLMVTLDDALSRSHRANAAVVERNALIEVEALDAGAWGNRLRVSIADEPTGLVVQTTMRQIVNATVIRLASAAGVEAGTILEIFDSATQDTIGAPVKVTNLNRATGEITLAGTGLSLAQQVLGLGVRSREFRLSVYLLRQPDLSVPTRGEMILDTEVFRYLSLDPHHSRYIHKIIGTTFDPTPGTTADHDGRPLRRSDHRSEGESRYVRVRDLAQDLPDGLPAPPPYRGPTLASAHVGPEALMDILPNGQRRPARHRLERIRGDDSIGTLNDPIYVGDDDPNPENRTGLQSLRNIEEISIVACPGRVGAALQSEIINHCELLRYRFAVLDAPGPPQDSLNHVQNHRQQFDTKYAALYHPWLLIPDPFPTNLAEVADYPIPASGHMVGIYARTDIERGVHKAPANEVVRGVIGLQRLLNKGEQDILNPFPVNINVIRDFRPNNRGIRVWGGRVITSDPDWKYVNVRRLLIFIEASIDRGLQWVVFEPNAEPLWARVHRSASNFLTSVWRDGALEGTKPEEAYFVKVDRTTMTQTEIDNGKLIVLIGVAPVKPAEFVIIRIGLWTAHADT